MFSIKQNKVARLIQKELGDIFLKEDVGLPVEVMVTITVVRVTADLGIARVYLSIFPSKGNTELINFLNLNKKHIRFLLGNRIRNQMKEIPDLDFFVDDSLDYIDHIEELLKPKK